MIDVASAGQKNFIQNNISKVAQQSFSKLDRLKKLQIETNKLMTENRKLKTNSDLQVRASKQRKGHEQKEKETEAVMNNDDVLIVKDIVQSADFENVETMEGEVDQKNDGQQEAKEQQNTR